MFIHIIKIMQQKKEKEKREEFQVITEILVRKIWLIIN